MRITIVNFTRRRIGGTEQNLNVVLPELEARGHKLQFVYFHDEPAHRPPVQTSADTLLVHAGAAGEGEALRRIREFHPDLINVHGDILPAFQHQLLEIAPAAYSVHNYYGTCISGLKTMQFPVVQPCEHTFGPACLLRYFPRRCGGRSPVTMVRRYALERQRLAVLSRYDAVITHSRHMESEYMRHGLYPARVYGLPYEVAAEDVSIVPVERSDLNTRAHLLFVGRIEKLKGGEVLLRSLPQVQRALARPVELHFAGDGPDRAAWERLANRITARNPQISVRFHGWVMGPQLGSLFRETNLLVAPSLWPEPFGKVGPEAAVYGVPVAAFLVGGIDEWLLHGVNGMAAPGNPPTVKGLAHTIVDCLGDAKMYASLCDGALESVKRFDLQVHVDRLLEVFNRICALRGRSLALTAAVGSR